MSQLNKLGFILGSQILFNIWIVTGGIHHLYRLRRNMIISKEEKSCDKSEYLLMIKKKKT